MNKRELVESITGEVDASRQQVEAVIDCLIQTVGSTLSSGGRVALTGFGAFEPRKRKARTGLNPQTGKKIPIKATTVPAFKPGQALKDEVASGGRGGAKKASAKKSAPKKTAKKASAKKAAPKKTAKKASAKKAAPKKTAKKASAKKAAPKKTAKKASAKKAAPKKTAKKASAKKSVRKR